MALTAAKSPRSATNTVVLTTCAGVEPGAGQHRRDVFEHTPRLGLDPALDQRARLGIEADLARAEHKVPGADGLVVGSTGERLGSAVGDDNLTLELH